MSTAIARSIYPNGHLYTFEFNSTRAFQAAKQFKICGLDQLITVKYADVCGKIGDGGFGAELDGKADAVFLDLPEPWLALPHAYAVLKENKYICTYSPCIEQVQQTCKSLKELGFYSIETVELRERSFQLYEVDLDLPVWEKTAVSQEKDTQNNEIMMCDSTENKVQSSKQKNNKSHPKEALNQRHLFDFKSPAEMRGHTAFLTFATKGTFKVNADTSMEMKIC